VINVICVVLPNMLDERNIVSGSI